MASIMEGVDNLTQLVGRNRLELLLFRLGGRQRFAINVFKVREVIKCPPLTHMPQSHSVVRGVANIRGTTITVIDLAAAVGRPPIGADVEKFVIVAEFNRNVQGFLVSGVERIVNMNWEDVKPPPSGVGQNYLTAVTRVGDDLVEIIDVEKVRADVMGVKTDLTVSLAVAAHEIPPRILIADDSSVARKHMLRVMEQLGIEVVFAIDGREALEKLLEVAQAHPGPVSEHIRVVISDIEMPEMDGYTLTKRIREHPQLKDLYVILHTSLSGTFNVQMVERVGADLLIPKFDPDELAQAVVGHLTSHHVEGVAHMR